MSDPGGGGTAPAAPAISSVTAISQSQLDVTMNINSRATTTTLERSLSATAGFAAIATISSTGNGIVYNNTGLTLNTTYYYRARSSNEFGTSAYSSPVMSGKTLGLVDPPAIVSGIAVTPGTPPTTVAIVSFNPVPPKTQAGITYPNTYSVYFSTLPGNIFPGVTTPKVADATGSPVIVSGLIANTLYYVNVASRNAGGYGFQPQAEVQYRTAVDPNAAPSAPSGFTATPVVGSYTAINLAWTDNSTNEVSFLLERATNAIFTTGYSSTSLSANSTSFQVTGLAPTTTYHFRLRAVNSVGVSSSAVTASGTTNAAPLAPGIPWNVSATTIDYSRIEIKFSPLAPLTAEYYSVRRALSALGPWTDGSEVRRIDARSTDTPSTIYSYIDKRLSPGQTYYYRISAVNFTNTPLGALSGTVNATTDVRAVGFMTSPPWSFHEDSTNNILTVLGTTIYTSNMDRWIIRTASGSWYKAGLKRPLNAAVLSHAAGSGNLQSGTYRVYMVLLRSDGEARSTPSPVSNAEPVPLGNEITVEIPLDGDGFVECRDIGYDISGNEILGADYVEIYIADATSARAYLVDTLELDPTEWEETAGMGDYKIDPIKRYNDIFSASNRTMELLDEHSLPPSASEIVFKGTHLEAFGETTLEPNADDQGNNATLTINRGAKSFTVSNYMLPEAAVYHELWVGGEPTGWEVWDIDGSTGYIRHGVSAISKAGFNGAGGVFKSFKFVPKNRVYFSAYFTGGWGRVFNIQGFPPLTTFRNEFAPEDNTEPNAARAIGDEVVFFKPGRILLQRGGDEPDVPRPVITSISSGSGCIAPKTICVDRRDNFYYLGDTGVHRANAAGVERIIDQTGNSNLFRELFEINNISDAIGEYFSRDDLAVFANMDLIGESGGRSGCIYDTRNNAILPFTLDHRITSLTEELSIYNEYQLHFGTEYGQYGILFDKGVYVDGNNYTLTSPTIYGQPIRFFMRTGSLDTEHALSFISAQPRIHHSVDGTRMQMYISIGGNNRNASPDFFVAKKTINFYSDDNRDRLDFGGNGPFQNGMVEFGGYTSQEFQTSTPRWRDLQISVLNRGAGKS
jgi:hypothetical protein